MVGQVLGNQVLVGKLVAQLLDPKTRTCTTFLGGPATKLFNEPAGLSFAGDQLFVADTNNHRIQVVDVKSKETRTLALTGVEPPAARAPAK